MTILVLLAGTIMGSFFNVCICRIPRGESISYPSSHCTTCGHILTVKDMIPIFSYIFLKGKCRYCSRSISIQYLLVELLTGGLYMCLYIKLGIGTQFFFYTILLSILIIVSVIDIYNTIIPSSLVIIGSIAAISFNLLGWGRTFSDGIYGALAGAGAITFMDIIALLFFKKQGMGGGDIRLMAMVGLFMGLKHVLLSVLFSVYIGGIVFMILMIMGKIKKTDYIPFGPFLSMGTLISLFFGNQIIMWYYSTFIY